MNLENLKIRAWDSLAQQMLYSSLVQFDDMLGFSFVHFYADPATSVEYMLFTGLKDANQIDIYDGDIVRYVAHPKYQLASFVAEIRYIQEYACFGYRKLGLNEFGCNHVVIHPFSDHDEFTIDVLPHLHVIGDIYQNPEWLIS